MLAKIDAQVGVYREAMNTATAEGDQIAQAIPPSGSGPSPGAPGAAPPPLRPASPPANPSQEKQLSPAKINALKKNQGQPVTFGDGITAIMKQDGTIQVIGAPIDRTVH